GSDDAITSLTFLDGGRLLAGVGPDKALRVWDAKTRAETRRIPLSVPPANQQHFAALSPDGKTAVVLGGKYDTLTLIDLATGREVGRLHEEKGHWRGA